MLYTAQTRRAMQIAYAAHHSQFDKSGVPYIFHPFHVAEQLATEEEIVTALLHDVVEDTGISLQQLAEEGFSPAVIEAVRLLTHDEAVPYLDYIDALKTNPIARAVKLADLRHNSDLSRQRDASDKTLKRLEKYAAAIKRLE